MVRRVPGLRSKYARRAPVREPYEQVLIVCEGEKTEPLYFHGLRAAYRLSSLKIEHPEATDPLSIVQYAEAFLPGDKFQKIYCVFDQDNHQGYRPAIDRIKNSAAGRQGRLIGITSAPCFEVWLLLHFRYSSGPLSSAEALRELRTHIQGYTKAHTGIFDLLSGQMDAALAHAERLARIIRHGERNEVASVI